MVMLNPTNLAPKKLAGNARRQQLINSLTGTAVPEPLKDKPDIESVADEVVDLPQKMGATILIEGNMIDIGE